jgi:hypothetical protein
MKRILFVTLLLLSYTGYSQILDYNQLGVLMTDSNQETTARTMAMKGAFGALGGDLSAISVNPGGMAVFNTSAASFTLGYTNGELISDFYGTKTHNENETFNLSQAGAIFVFENDTHNSDVKAVSFAINYQKLYDFKNTWNATGISIPTWEINYFNSDDENIYNHVEFQNYTNITDGLHTELNLGIGANIDDNLYVGASFNAYELKYIEDATRHEIAYAENGDYVDGFESFWQEVTGDGFSLSVGAIYKPSHALRFGLSYTSPSWYEMHEDSNMFAENEDDLVGYYDVLYSNDPPSYTNNISKVLAYDYQMRTPSKLTGSMAVVFDKNGLITADLSRKNYKGITVSPRSEFSEVNQNFDNVLESAYVLNLGTEWRFDNLSLRGGYTYQTSPYINAIDTDNIQGYAAGVGFNFGKYSLDLAYDYTEKTDFFDYYPDFPDIDETKISKNQHKVLATLSFKF